jgi:hypothetical protein
MPVRHPFQIVEEQISALHTLRKISRQPLALEAMRLIVLEHYGLNGVANGATQKPANGRAPERRGAIWDTGITKAIEKILPTLQGEFSYNEVAEALEKDGYQIIATNARTAIGRVLRRLATRRKITLSRRGIAGEPSFYRLAA